MWRVNIFLRRPILFYLLAPHTSGPRDVPRFGALSLLQKTLQCSGGSAEIAPALNVKFKTFKEKKLQAIDARERAGRHGRARGRANLFSAARPEPRGPQKARRCLTAARPAAVLGVAAAAGGPFVAAFGGLWLVADLGVEVGQEEDEVGVAAEQRHFRKQLGFELFKGGARVGEGAAALHVLHCVALDVHLQV